MGNNINSFAENMNKLVLTANNQMSILNGLKDSMVSNNTTVYVSLTDPDTGQTQSMGIPSVQGIVNRLNGVENAMKALLQGKGTASLGDGTSRQIQITPLAKIPENIFGGTSPTNFGIDANWFFEDLMFPGITVSVNLAGQVDAASDRVRVKRVILDSRVTANQILWTNSISGVAISYGELISLLNTQGIEYSEDEETLDFPLTSRKYEGTFIITASNIINDAIWYTLDSFDYYEITPTGPGAAKTLTIGDRIAYENSVLEITGINYGEHRVRFKYSIGNETPGINSYLEYYEEPFTEKIIDVRIGIHEYDIIYFKGINEAFNLLGSSWGYPITFYTDNLVNDDGIPLSTYYANNIVDWGTQLIADAKNKTISAYEGVTPDAPILSADAFSVVQINTQINAALDVAEFKNIVADIDTNKSNINSLRNTIASQKSDLQSIINLEEYKNLQDQINSNTIELTQLQNTYRSLLNQAHDLLKENRAVIQTPKYHIRGFFPIPAPKTNISTANITSAQQVIGFEIQYRYIKEDSTGVDLKRYSYLDADGLSTVTGIYSDWNIMSTQTLEKAYNEATGAYEWVNESIADGTIININQVDIPISKGEKVEFRIRSISEAGWPANPLKSVWSNSVIMAFPENLSTVSEADNLVEDINNENTNASVDNILNSLGVYTHLSDTIPNVNSVNGIYYKHQADYVAYELIKEQDGVNKTIETISVQEAIDRILANEISTTYSKAELDNLGRTWGKSWVKTTRNEEGVPIPIYTEDDQVLYDKIYLTPNGDGGYDAWILDLADLDLNHDGYINSADVTLAYQKMNDDLTIDNVILKNSIYDFILGNTNIKDFWKPLTNAGGATAGEGSLKARVTELEEELAGIKTILQNIVQGNTTNE